MRSIQTTVSGGEREEEKTHILLWIAVKSDVIYVFAWGVVRHQINVPTGKKQDFVFKSASVERFNVNPTGEVAASENELLRLLKNI